jgi:hypothetical protein
MVNWLDGARRARYRVNGLAFEAMDAVAGKSINETALKMNKVQQNN